MEWGFIRYVSTTPFCLCQIFMEARLGAWICNERSLHTEGMTPVQAEGNKVSVV